MIGLTVNRGFRYSQLMIPAIVGRRLGSIQYLQRLPPQVVSGHQVVGDAPMFAMYAVMESDFSMTVRIHYMLSAVFFAIAINLDIQTASILIMTKRLQP